MLNITAKYPLLILCLLCPTLGYSQTTYPKILSDSTIVITNNKKVQSILVKDKNGNDEYLWTWTFTSERGDINLTFKPLIDRYSNTNALIIQSKQHQVFGVFSGCIKVKGKEFIIDNLIGFAEKVKK